MSLFKPGDFHSHSGALLSWKIDCDALTDSDLECLALLIGQRLVFGQVHGIPTGGERIASALRKYITEGASPRLIVDDVATTFESMEAARQSDDDFGIVIFARSEPPEWVEPIFTLGPIFEDTQINTAT